MSSWLILLLLLMGNQNGCDNGDDCGRGHGSNGPQFQDRSGERGWNDERGWGSERNWNGNGDGDCGCDNDSNRGRNRNSDCDNDNNRGRGRDFNDDGGFESRFDSRPADNSGCGCNNQ